MLHAFDDFTVADDVLDIDPLGNKIWKDPERATRNYWGFSYEGLEKMKENRKMFKETATGYEDVRSVPPPFDAMYGADAVVSRTRDLAPTRGFGERGRGRGGRGNWRGDRGGRGFRGGRGRGSYHATDY